MISRVLYAFLLHEFVEHKRIASFMSQWIADQNLATINDKPLHILAAMLGAPNTFRSDSGLSAENESCGQKELADLSH
ncbi:hypothetical protein [uncultured Cohaesibacter sp.]|uniref:hypothetical protein n=1 Tax=uncultured Cohaesibacter sp. TaxID=1002546 RepID=UPI0029C610E4|nr:hypothetical protein [uncultured Cohaesibacter sp.]